MRKLFLIPIVCSLLLAGCGGETKEPQASAPVVRQSADGTAKTGGTENSPSPSFDSAAESPSSSPSAGSDDQDGQPPESAPSAAGRKDDGEKPSAVDKPKQEGNKSRSAPGSGTDGITPAEIEIPDIGVDAKVVALGLTEDGAMDVPKNDDDVGWFKPGYRPGAPGHSVMAGHVDSKTGPAVLFKLKTLKKGSKIIIRSKEGEERVFRVIGSKSYPYDDAPLEEIFGPSDKPLLNVITCTGLYSRSKRTHQERLVVTAELVTSSAA